MTSPSTRRPSSRSRSFALAVSVIGGLLFVAFGVWAMVAPGAFFEAAARFEPYNQHFIQDIGAFQIGLGAVLLLAAGLAGLDGLTVGLLGVGAGSAAHLLSHIIGRDLGGNPTTDIPFFTVLTLLFLAGGLVRLRARDG